MSDNKRPDTRIVLKSKEGGHSITLAAYWTDGERPSGGLDRRIKRLKVEWEDQDGTNAGKESTHYCNLWADSPGTPQRSSGGQRAPKSAPVGGGYDPNDDCPF